MARLYVVPTWRSWRRWIAIIAIFHLSVKVISRSSGRSAVAAAAYRGGERLHDERLDRDHDFTNKDGVVHSEVLLPEGAPEEFADREKLWNAVEAAEKRKDAQLAREVEFALPRELTKEQAIELAREFAEAEFVEKGMIADLNVHWDIGKDGQPKPHAHVMLTMREVGKDGFGAKVREWNKAELVEQWRERWAEHVNQRLAELDIDARIDHRSLEAQGIALEPQDKIGPAASRMGERGLEAERIEEHRAVAQRNGERIIASPAVALDAITHSQATFLTHTNDEVRELNDAARGRLRASGELGNDVTIRTERGEREFADGDRIMFLRNERGLGVKNGTLGTIEQASPQRMTIGSVAAWHMLWKIWIAGPSRACTVLRAIRVLTLGIPPRG